LGMTENTMVVFMSDHGEMMGDHGMWQKGMPYEASARVPMIIRCPGRIHANVVNDDLVSLLDLAPTFYDLAERDRSEDAPLAGASLLGREGGGLAEPREHLVGEIGRGASRWLSLRSSQWKYSRWLRDGWEELYDLENDPNEDHNLLLGEVPTEILDRAKMMCETLTDWERENGFADSLNEDGSLINFGMAPTDPSQHRVNGQFPRWVDRLPKEEQAVMEKRGETVVNAIASEDTFDLENLDLAAFKRAGGSLDGTGFQEQFDQV